MSKPSPATVELVERIDTPDGLVIPNEIRINGVAVSVPAGYPVTISDMTSNDPVMVTLTIFARRVSIHQEPKSVQDSPT